MEPRPNMFKGHFIWEDAGGPYYKDLDGIYHSLEWREISKTWAEIMGDVRLAPDMKNRSPFVPDLSHLGYVEPDMVNHPPHYTTHPSGIECIQITEHMNFNVGNAVKYLWRADNKNGLEDLKKAAWYVNREIERLTNE